MPLECEVWSIHNKQWPVVLYASSKGETCTAVVRASTFRASTQFPTLHSKKNYFYALFRFYAPVLVQERSSAIFPHLSLQPDSSSQTLKKKKKITELKKPPTNQACSLRMVCRIFYVPLGCVNSEGLWDGAYGLKSLSEKTWKSNHLRV